MKSAKNTSNCILFLLTCDIIKYIIGGRMKNNLKKNYFVLISIMVLWIIISFFVVQPQYFRKLVSSISDLVIKEEIIVINRNNTKNKLIEKTGVTSIRIYSNGTEIGNTVKIKTGDVLRDNSDEYSIAVLGDVNKDGIVDLSDASRTYRIFKNLVTPTKVERMSADSTKDNTINISDVSRTYRIFKNLVPDDDSSTPTPTPVTKYTVTFNSNGGSTVSSITKNSGESIGTLPSTAKTNYQFIGWFTDINAGTQITSATKVTGNTTYYAHWKLNVLFIGNSKTFYNHMPQLFEKMAETAGRDVDVDMVAVNGRALKCHGYNCTVEKNADYIGLSDKGTRDYIVQKLNNKIFGVIVIQEQTEASELESEALKGVNSIKSLVTSSSKSNTAVIYNNVIWRKLKTDTNYSHLCAESTYKINIEQKNAGRLATDIQGNQTPREIVVKTGRLLFRYECEEKELNVPAGKYHLYHSDRNHPQPGASYLEAGLIYAAIFGKPSSSIIVGSGWDCTNNHYNVNTGTTSFTDHNKHSFTKSSEEKLWQFIIDNYNLDISR